MQGFEALPERIRSQIQRFDNSCWIWVGLIHKGGYGVVGYKGRHTVAHRVCYEILCGPIPEGLTLDHLCKVPACVNPSHMEPVSMRENILRSNGVGGVNARKTHCPHGHEYAPENTLTGKHGLYRRCRTCVRNAWLHSDRRLVRLRESAQRKALRHTKAPNLERQRQRQRAAQERRDKEWRAKHGVAPDVPLTYWDKQLISGTCITAQHAMAAHCPRGHAYDTENTYVSQGKRFCRACHRESEKLRRAIRRKG